MCMGERERDGEEGSKMCQKHSQGTNVCRWSLMGK